MQLKKILSLILCGALTSAIFSACSAANESSTSGSSVTDNNKESEITENMTNTYFAASENVKLLGRTNYSDNMLWCGFSGSGCEFTVKGTYAEITILGDSTSAVQGNDDNYSRVAIYVDGQRVVDEMMNETEKTFSAFKSDTEKEVDIRIVKLSETAMSTIAIKEIKTDGKPVPVKDKAHYIEFVGDSITCGYGVDDENKAHHFSTKTEDVTKAYAYKTAEALDADYSMVSISGYGIISGYSNDGNKVSAQTLPQYYDKLGFSYGNLNGNLIQDVEWDFSKRNPELIVINLGTNDDSYCKDNATKQAEYKDGYIELLKKVRSKNPDSKILCAFGIMGDRLYPVIEQAVSEYSKETGDKNIDSLKFAVQDGSNGYAADWHPTEATHKIASEAAVEKIKAIMNW